MIKLNRIFDAYFYDRADYYTCEKNIASMTVVTRRQRFGDCKLTQITTFAGEKVEVTETPEEIFKKLKQESDEHRTSK